MHLFLLLAAMPVWGAEDVNGVVKRLIEAERDNHQRAQQYTYVEQTERYNFNKKGDAHRTEWLTHDVIFVEGLQYKKLVARNGKALRGREQARVENDMRQTAEERRRHERQLPAGGVLMFSGLFGQQRLDLGSLPELLTLYDNRVTGEETVRGHKAWVIECTPRTGYVPRNRHEEQVLVFRKRFWVDQKDTVLVRAIYTIAPEGAAFTAGSSLTFEFEKVDGAVWEPVSLTLDFSRMKVFRPEYRTVYRMSGFKKFDVQSTITVDEPEK